MTLDSRYDIIAASPGILVGSVADGPSTCQPGASSLSSRADAGGKVISDSLGAHGCSAKSYLRLAWPKDDPPSLPPSPHLPITASTTTLAPPIPDALTGHRDSSHLRCPHAECISYLLPLGWRPRRKEMGPLTLGSLGSPSSVSHTSDDSLWSLISESSEERRVGKECGSGGSPGH